VSLLRSLLARWRKRVRNYAPRGFPDAESCGAFYDARSRLFRGDEAAILEYSSLAVQQRLFERAVDALPSHGRVLDVGCGLAHLFDFLEGRKLGFDAYCGIDVSASMIRRAAERVGKLDRVRLEVCDLTAAPLPSASHDVGYLISVLGYPIGRDPMAVMMTILGTVFRACTDGLVFTHLVAGRRERPLAFATIPEELAARCERELDAHAVVFDDGVDFTYLIRLRHRKG
jgi:SAM-dependent methyltransferase